jgi:hypothetical protein
VWLRRSMRSIFPDLFATLAVPKAEELVASPYRHGTKEKAEKFFLDGMTQAMHRLAKHAHPTFPVTIYYAFKQSENEVEAGNTSTGWETFLNAVDSRRFFHQRHLANANRTRRSFDWTWHKCTRIKHRPGLPAKATQRSPCYPARICGHT